MWRTVVHLQVISFCNLVQSALMEIGVLVVVDFFFFFWGGDLLQIILQFRTALTASHSMQQTEQCYLLCKALCESCRCMQHSQNSLQNVWWALAMSFSLWRLLIRERWLWPGLQGETSPVFTCLGDDVSEGSGIGFILLKARLRCAGKCGSI